MPYQITGERLTSLFRPRSVALVGASDKSVFSQIAYHNLVEFGFADQQRAQTLCWNEQRLDVAFRRCVDKRRASGKLADIRQELAGTLFSDRRYVAQTIALADRHLALEQDEHAGADLSGLKELLAVRIFAVRAIAPQPLDFLRCQLRKRLLVARNLRRKDGISHWS